MSSSPDRWRFLEELYRAAIERPSGERDAFLQEACPDEHLPGDRQAVAASADNVQAAPGASLQQTR